MRVHKSRDSLQETYGALKQRLTPRAVLKDYSLRHQVEMRWDLSKEAERERIFLLKIDDYEVLLDWEEMMKAGRFV